MGQTNDVTVFAFVALGRHVELTVVNRAAATIVGNDEDAMVVVGTGRQYSQRIEGRLEPLRKPARPIIRVGFTKRFARTPRIVIVPVSVRPASGANVRIAVR